MGTRYLIDSNILIKFEGNLLTEQAKVFVSEIIDEEFNISIISEMEVLGHQSVTKDMEEFIGLANLFEIDSSVRAMTILLRKVYKIKLPDAIIAATGLVHRLVIITQNEKDFKSINGLTVINPFTL